MSRYKKLIPRFWKDEKVATLNPEEKLIAIYIYTAQSNRIGIFSFSIGEAIEDCGTLPETFPERFGNVCKTLNIHYDKQARVIYIPTWWKYNPPENANNVIGNLKDLADLPDTPLIALFACNLDYLDETLHQTFTLTLAKRYRNVPQTSAKRSGTQYQEQEQKQEQDNKTHINETDEPGSLIDADTYYDPSDPEWGKHLSEYQKALIRKRGY